jgi:hypothetical protein
VWLEGARHGSGRVSVEPGIADQREDNPIWRFPGFRVEATRSWGLISADVISRDAGEATWLSGHHRISCALTDYSGTIESDGRREHRSVHRGKIGFGPAGQVARIDVPVAVRYIQILQSPDTYHNFVGDLVRGGAVSLESRSNVDDPLASQIALTLAGDLESGFLDHLLADALNTALAVRVMRLFADPSAINFAPSNGLSRGG